MVSTISEEELEAFLRLDHTNPHRILGRHRYDENHFVIRTFYPNAKEVFIVNEETNETLHMKRFGNTDLFEGQFHRKFKYHFKAIVDSKEKIYKDPYLFSPALNDEDLYLFNQGNHHRIYNKMGAHLVSMQGIEGYSFAVWAPNARRVSVVGDFNRWDGRCHPMRLLGHSGIWELFIPELKSGFKYKFELYDANQQIQLKADPYAHSGEYNDGHASILCESLDAFKWNDDPWLNKRSQQNCKTCPLSIYELHLDSWKHDAKDKPLNYRELAKELVEYLKTTGFNYVEFMPIAEHPFAGSWGYQVTGFFAPTSRYGTPQDFQYLVDTLHKNNIGVIIDWVPGHFPKDAFGLAKFDGTALYEHSDPRQGEHQDWGTLIFNYGRNEVRNFLISNALFWIDKFHIDGLRVDAVASMLYLNYSRKDGEWIPNRYGGQENIEAIEFIRSVNDLVHLYYPGVITIAEESTSFGRVSQPTQAYGLGFDFKWNMGWMHDVLSYCQEDPIFRKYRHNKMTFAMLYQYSENFISVFSHDEVVYGKCSMVQKMGSVYFTDKLSTLRALYGFMWGWPGKKTLFMGNEFAQCNEWNYNKQLDWYLLNDKNHSGVKQLIYDLNKLYFSHKFWYEYDMRGDGFSWINPNDCDNSVFSFIRKNSEDQQTLLFVANFTPMERYNYECGAPFKGKWQEILNTDANIYGGQNRGNQGMIHTIDQTRDNQPAALRLYLPPLSTLVFEYKG